MKKDIHPKYYPRARVQCACGNAFTVGSTKEFIEVEICSKCHPFYTGKEKIIDTINYGLNNKDALRPEFYRAL